MFSTQPHIPTYRIPKEYSHVDAIETSRSLIHGGTRAGGDIAARHRDCGTAGKLQLGGGVAGSGGAATVGDKDVGTAGAGDT